MNTATLIPLPQQSLYGATEIKEFIRKNTYRALLLSSALLSSLLLAYILLSNTENYFKNNTFAPPLVLSGGIQLPTDEVLPKTPEIPIKEVLQLMTKNKAGTPVPIPEANIREDIGTFANFDELNKSLPSKQGILIDGSDIPINTDLKDATVKKEELVPGIGDFQELEKEPEVDLADLQKKVVYPELARISGVQGKVVVRVLIGKDGKVKKSVIQSSASEMLEQAAVDAVMKTVFLPGIQNNVAVSCWVSIPIEFKLK